MLRQLFDLRRFYIPLFLLALLPAVPAQAHFLWISVEEGTRKPRVTFGETPDETTPQNLVARLAEARAWDGQKKAVVLTQGEDGWTGQPSGPAAAVTQSWGVVDRSGDGTGAFLLEYYAKGAAGLEDTAADLKLPFEISARREAGQIVAMLRRGGQPVANSPVHVSLPSGRSFDRTSDAGGEVRFDSEGGGLYGIRARWLEDRQGESDGKAYGEVRHYTTLTFALSDRPATASSTDQPAAVAEAGGAAKPQQADPAAYALLKKAHDSRQVMPADFAGFRSELTLQQGDKILRGELVYRRQGETEVQLQGADEESLGWARGQILNLVGHRRGGDFAQGDGRHPLQLGPEDGNPYGQLIVLNDGLQSSYRVRDNRVTEVTRTSQGSRFTISVMETMDADDGKYLANHFLVTYRDATTGALQKFEGYRDSYSRLRGVWLPTSRTVIEVSDKTSPIVRTLRLRKIEPLGTAVTRKEDGAQVPASGATP